MTLLLSMFPLYLLGNLHCMGMCGPLVAMIGQHRYRHLYFLGRLLSFTFAAMLAGGAGAVLHLFLKDYQIPALTSFLFGGVISAFGVAQLFGWKGGTGTWLTAQLAGVNQSLSLLMLRDQPLSTFLFGFFTVFLPCGQTVIVFSACALEGDLFVGMVNGAAFALLTSPSLYFAMQAHRVLGNIRRYERPLMGTAALVVGGIALCRGFAELGVIEHGVVY